MARIKGGLNAKKKHNRVLKLAKGISQDMNMPLPGIITENTSYIPIILTREYCCLTWRKPKKRDCLKRRGAGSGKRSWCLPIRVLLSDPQAGKKC